MTRIAILTPSITSGDAVSNDVIEMYYVLKGRGFETRIFAEGWTIESPEILPASRLPGFLKNSNDVLIYHYSRGWDPGLALLRDLKCHSVVRYHNVTPPEFFDSYNQDLAAMCQAGREQLKPIANAACDRYLSASSYSMRELLREGAAATHSFVVPPFHHIDRLASLTPDADVLRRCRDGKTNICMVGRVAPNKAHPALIEAFAAYFHDYNRNSRLLIVGKEETRLRNYSPLLRELVTRLELGDAVVFAGEVTDAELKAYYQSAHAFMITSEHEGFCVPLVEAMSMGLPIVAYASSAIPETVGDAGLVWENRDPNLLAASLATLLTNQSLSEGLSKKGRRRYQEHFTNAKIEQLFLEAMGGIL
jgi:glycosyltransferase involved in cell wall biosynthesis